MRMRFLFFALLLSCNLFAQNSLQLGVLAKNANNPGPTATITPLDAALEYNTTQGIRGYIEFLSPTRAVVANYQSATVQNVQTFELNRSTGAWTANSSPLTFYAGDGLAASIISIVAIPNTNKFAMWWTGADSDGFARTFQVDEGTGAVTAWGAQVEYDATNGGFPSAVNMDGYNHFLNVWQGTDNDGFAAIFEVDMEDGDFTMYTPFEFDTDLATRLSLKYISASKAIVSYQGNSSDGYARVLNVNTSSWLVTGAASSFEWLDASTINQNSVEIMTTTPTVTAINAFDNNLSAGLRQLSINNWTWAITNLGTPVTGIVAVNQNNSKRVVLRLRDDYFVYFNTGTDNDGFVELRNFTPSTGAISSAIASTEFDTDNAISISACDMGDGIIAAIWGGAGNDGYLRAFRYTLPERFEFVTEIEVSTEVGRQGEDVDVEETANKPSAFDFRIFDELGNEVADAQTQSAIFNIADSGFYSVKSTVSRANELDRYLKMYLKIKPPVYESGDADLVLDLDAIQAGTFTNPLGDASISGNGTDNFLYNFNNVVRPGFKIILTGSYSGRIQIIGLQGTEAEPVRIQSPTTGQAIFEENYASQTMAIHFNGFNQYIHIDGQASSTHKYGILIQGNGTDEARGILWQGDQQRSFIIAGVEFSGRRARSNTTAGGAAFQYAPPTPDAGENASNWNNGYFILHDNYIHDGWGEGIYKNFNDDTAVGGLYYNRTTLFLAFDNIIERMLRDGIQISSCDNAVIVRNTIRDIGHEASTSHRSGIQINPGNFNVHVSNNYVTDVDVFLAAQSGDTGTGDLYTYSNFALQRETILTATPNQFVYHNVNDLDYNYHFFNNTIICATVAIAPVTIERSSGGESYDFTFAGNVILTGGTDQATYDELRIVGTHDQTDWFVDNVWERTADEDDLILDIQYKPLTGSPALDGGFNWQTRFPDVFLPLERNRDYFGYSLLNGVDYVAGYAR